MLLGRSYFKENGDDELVTVHMLHACFRDKNLSFYTFVRMAVFQRTVKKTASCITRAEAIEHRYNVSMLKHIVTKKAICHNDLWSIKYMNNIVVVTGGY